jgi:hypothetical protein
VATRSIRVWRISVPRTERGPQCNRIRFLFLERRDIGVELGCKRAVAVADIFSRHYGLYDGRLLDGSKCEARDYRYYRVAEAPRRRDMDLTLKY